MRVLLIGGGNMGGAFARAFIKGRKLRPADLTIVETDSGRRRALQRELGCAVLPQTPADSGRFGLVILATKPQQLMEVRGALKGKLGTYQVLLSIMAGISAEVLRKNFDGHKKIICCMPNLPVQVAQGMSVIFATSAVAKRELAFVQRLLSGAGKTLLVSKPALIDAATSISASGCGFVFYLIENMIKAASQLGYGPHEAELMVQQTLQGTLELWKQSGSEPSLWRERVTSKGGTTQAGLEEFTKGKLGDVLVKGYKRAYRRCAELRRRRG
ncbi:MAG: pyrroline-5-carboxylate reductase [Oligoflexia bacterium]|nr:pyrroline-5-carboxylate reductase [Oligoflexia bacterium]